jgi:hypothetical protein
MEIEKTVLFAGSANKTVFGILIRLYRKNKHRLINMIDQVFGNAVLE